MKKRNYNIQNKTKLQFNISLHFISLHFIFRPTVDQIYCSYLHLEDIYAQLQPIVDSPLQQLLSLYLQVVYLLKIKKNDEKKNYLIFLMLSNQLLHHHACLVVVRQIFLFKEAWLQPIVIVWTVQLPCIMSN